MIFPLDCKLFPKLNRISVAKQKIVIYLKVLQIQQEQLLDLRRHFNNYVDSLPVFGFNSGKYDLNLIKAYLIPYLLNDRDIQPTVIKKANQFISFKFGDIQFLDILKILAGATSLDFFLKAYQSEETKGYFPYEWFDSFTKLDCNHLPPYEFFFSKLKNLNPLEKDFSQFKKTMESGKKEFDFLRELGLKEKPLSGKENNALLEKVWMMEKMTTFRDFLRWYNNKDVVPTLQAMKKMMKFYHDQKIDLLKLGCTLPNLANICLHKSTDRKFYPFIEADKDLLEKIRSEMTGGLSIVFTRKAVVDKTFIRRSNNICKTIVGIDASQLYPFSMCQAMPTGVYTRWEFDTNIQKLKARQNKIRKFENMVTSFYQATRPECTIESFYTTGKQRNIDSFTVHGFCGHCQTIFEALGCYYHFCPCRETRTNLNEDEFEFGIRKRESDKLRKLYLEKKGYKVIEMRECEWWDHVQENSMFKNHIRKSFPYKLLLSKETLLTRIHEDKLFGYVQCDLEVPEELRERFANFPPIFKNCDVGRENIGKFMLEYAEKNALLLKPPRMLISSYKLNNGIVITPLLKFYLKLGLRCTKIHRLVEYTPQKCFIGFVQSVVDARREGDENPDSSVVAETMKLLGNSSYGYQIMDRSRHTETLYLNDEKTHKAINNRLFRRLKNVSTDIYI